MKPYDSLLASSLCLLCAAAGLAQPPGNEKIVQALEKDGCAVAEGTSVRVCRYDYTVDGHAVESLSFRPAGEERFPGVLLIPGFSRTARDLIALGGSRHPDRRLLRAQAQMTACRHAGRRGTS